MNEQIKKMAELLRSGATMLQDICPVCNSPLFKVDDEIQCAKCGYRPAAVPRAASKSENVTKVLARMNSTAVRKVGELEIEIAKTTDLDKLSKLAELTLLFLRILRLIEKFGETGSAKVE
jgi:UPF0148 protein